MPYLGYFLAAMVLFYAAIPQDLKDLIRRAVCSEFRRAGCLGGQEG